MPNRNATLFLTLCSYPSGPQAHLLVEDDWCCEGKSSRRPVARRSLVVVAALPARN